MFQYIKFIQLPVTDQDRALSFYKDKLNLNVTQDAPYQGDRRWIELEIPGAQTRIVFSKRNNEEPTDVPSLVIIADDVAATFETLSERGVQFTQEPTPTPWDPSQSFALFRDTEGNTIMLGSG